MKTDNGDSVVFEVDNLTSTFFNLMNEMRSQGKLCDVTLKVDGRSLSAHKIILCGTIPYFYAMFTSNMKESEQNEIEIKGLEADTLEAIINFSYSGKILITINTVHSLLAGAAFLQVQKLQEACTDFLCKKLQTSNIFLTRNLADSLDCTSLVRACDNHIQVFFEEVSLGEEFCELSFPEVLNILTSDELLVSSEEKVFEALMRWIKKDLESRRPHLVILLSKIRLPLISPEYLIDHIAKEELIRSSLECRDLLDEAKDYHLVPERRNLLQNFKDQPRCCKSVRGLIFAIGGLSTTGNSVATVETYDPVTDTWSVVKPMTSVRSRVVIAVLNNFLYAIGGYNDSERLATVEVYNPDKGCWSLLEDEMHYNRSAAGAAALQGKLYVCGGYDGVTSLNTVECYNVSKKEWTLVTSMFKHRSACGVVAFDGFLYALGGHDGLTIFNSVERYDPETDMWTEVTPMSTKRCRLGVTVLGKKLYACGGYDGSTFLDTMEVYNPETKKWKVLAPMNKKRSRVALVTNMEKLWAIGGYDGISNLSTTEIYDPRLNQWKFGPPMSLHEGGVGAGVVSLNLFSPHLQ